MDEIQDQMDGIEEDTEIVKDLYALVEQYQVPVNPEDLAVYQASLMLAICHLNAFVYATSRLEREVNFSCYPGCTCVHVRMA